MDPRLVVFPFSTGRGRPPVSLEPGVQDAVVKALEEGGTSDPRIDERARRLAGWEVKRAWFIVLTGAGAVTQAGGAIFRVVTGNDDWFQVGLSATLAFSFAGTCWAAVRSRRRALRYLAGR
ncbi:hypothetical protein [Actinoplanes sp. M2I2]|uniref:hypothetical protein n=1 Tax=Actinoplanes sp. M2I2 TaxID=1734444 RepID=UPI0020211F3E|nr:hypothetical protein [Actinoplanes sp. M2I2]